VGYQGQTQTIWLSQTEPDTTTFWICVM